ncbi:hypothetical protein GL50803_0014346 [Giardia duodenalis]|uniref:Uncharacterized protein n=1 Tax=Giardia intestinalis (strain ATCC 50803 / WB clone C6) TaxID=184922 RepID=D3KIC1_GIAIC|nr:hypothetical protein GL50803_0014346 [Giardia intestinalis]KAE8301445.1 hypothetical protein GL50803_0014346 [Giardia intestinalis]
MEYLFRVASQQSAPPGNCEDSSDDDCGYKGMDLIISEGNLLRVVRNKSTLGLCMVKHQKLLDYLVKEHILIEIMQLIFNRTATPLNSSLCTDTKEGSIMTDSIINPQPASPIHVTSHDLATDTAIRGQCYPVTLDDVYRAIDLIRTAERVTPVLTHIMSTPSILRIPFQAVAVVYGFFADRVHPLKDIVVNPASDDESNSDCKIEVTKAFDALLNICTLSVDNLPIFVDALEQPLFDTDETKDSDSSPVLLIDVWVQLLLLNRAGSSFVRLVTNPKDKPAPLLDKLAAFLSQRGVFSTYIDHLFVSTNTSCDSITSILVQSLNSQVPWCNTIVQEFPRLFSLFLLLTGNSLPADLPAELLSRLPTLSPITNPSLCLTSSVADMLVYMLRTIILDAVTISLNNPEDPTLEGKTIITLEFLKNKGYTHADSWTLFITRLLPALCTATVSKLEESAESSSGTFSVVALLMLKTVVRFIELTGCINDHIDSVLISNTYGCSSATLLSVISAATEISSCSTLPSSLRSLGWDVEPSEFFNKLRYGDAGRLCSVSIELIVQTVAQSELYSVLCKVMRVFPTTTVVLFLCSRLFIVAAFYLFSSDSELIEQALKQSGIFEELELVSIDDASDCITIRPVSEMETFSIDEPLPTKFLPYRFRSPFIVHLLGILRAFIRLAANVTQREYDSEWSRYLEFRESSSVPPTRVMTYAQLRTLADNHTSLRRLLLEHQKLASVSSAFLWLDRIGGNCYFKGLLPFSRRLLSLGISTYAGVSLESLMEYAEKEPVFATSQDWNVNANFSLKQNIVLGALKQMLTLQRGSQFSFTETDLNSIYNGIMSTSLDDEEDNNVHTGDDNLDTGQFDENVDVTSYLANNEAEVLGGQTDVAPSSGESETFESADVIAFAECLPEELEPPVELLPPLESDSEALSGRSEMCDIDDSCPAKAQSSSKELTDRSDLVTSTESHAPLVCTTAQELAHILHNSLPNGSTGLIKDSVSTHQRSTEVKTPDSATCRDQTPRGQYEQQINVIHLTSVDSRDRSYSPPPIPKSSSPPAGIHNRASRGTCSPNKPLAAISSIGTRRIDKSPTTETAILTEKSPRAKPATRPFAQSSRPVREAIKPSNEYCDIPPNEGRFMTFEEATAVLEKQNSIIGRRARVDDSSRENEFRPLPKKMMAASSSYYAGRFRDYRGRT